MRNSRALASWMSWLEFVSLRRRLKYLARKIMNRLENGKLFGAWVQWNDQIESHKEHMRQLEADRFRSSEQKKVEEQKRERALRMVQKMMNACLATTLTAWVGWVAQEKQDRLKIQRFLRKLLNRAVAGCFASWLEYVLAPLLLPLRPPPPHPSLATRLNLVARSGTCPCGTSCAAS
jgi:hypothetical protein